MTELARELAKVTYPNDKWEDLVTGLKQGYERQAKHVQRLILEARIEELNTMSTDYLLARSSRIAELQKELEELK